MKIEIEKHIAPKLWAILSFQWICTYNKVYLMICLIITLKLCISCSGGLVR